MKDKLEQLEKNLNKNKEVVFKGTILKISTEGITILGKTFKWRKKKK